VSAVDVVEILGALLVLSAFAATQLRRMHPHSTGYLALNTLGAGTLAVIAGLHHSWGFLLLEGTWAVVSLVSLLNARRHRDRPVTG
jgi:hypothetical protein